MNITVIQENFIKNLDLIGKISTKHLTLPILQCVLLEVKNSILTLRATNLEIGIETTINIEQKEEGIVAVPASVLIQTISLISSKNITLTTKNDTLIVEGENSKTVIKTYEHEEFPTIPHLKESGQILNGALFSLGIKTAAFAASQSSIKPELGSIYIFQKKEHSLTFVATDSFRLMEKTTPQKGVVLENSILIPQKNALELAWVCDTKNKDPQLIVNENQCALNFPDGVYITSRLTTGSFPDYEAIIPKEYITHTTLLKNDLLNAFKKTNIFLNKFFQVGIKVSNKTVTVSANSGEVGTTTELIEATTDGEDLSLNFNQRYINESLGHISGESITLHFAGIGRPMVIKGVDDVSLRYLVMPMNK